MNAGVLRQLLRGFAAGNRGRIALSIAAVALGVALGGAVDTLHSSALAEVEGAARALGGAADLEVRGPRSGFDEALYPVLAKDPEVAVASPIVEVEARIADSRETLRVMGIDIFRAARMQPAFLARGNATTAGGATDYLERANAWLTPAALARAGVKDGDTLTLHAGSRTIALKVAGALPALADGGAAAVMDIGAMQDFFGREGRLSRVELRLKAGVDVETFRARLLPTLPAGVTATTPDSLSGRLASLTRAYRVNLAALSLVALLTGLFLVFSALALQAARRRQEFALLRALGVTKRGLLALLAAEGAAVGIAGAAIGTVLGLLGSRAVLDAFGADLGAGYFRGLESTFAPDPVALAIIAALGIGVAMGGALWVARHVARLDVATGLRDRSADLPTAPPRGLGLAAVFVVAGAGLLALPAIGGLPLGGYAAIALWLAAAVLVTGPACRAVLARLSPSHPVAALAVAQVKHLPGHLSAAVAGIVVSAALCAAMAVMVHSFRVSLADWLAGVVGADLYVRASSQGDSGYFTPAEQARIASAPGVGRTEPLRYDRLATDENRSVTLIARPLDARVLAGFQAIPPVPVPARDPPAIWVSDAAIDLHGWKPGQDIALPLEGREVRVHVAGRFRDYARTWGAVLVDLESYRAITGDARANDVAVHLASGANADAAMAAIRNALPESRDLAIDEAADIHRRSLAAFDRTFAATYALEAIAIVIALAGVTSSFAALAWSRRREFGVMRHLGLTRGDILHLLAMEGAAAGALGAAMGLAAGAAISLVLIHVVNRQSFHWGLDVHWPALALAILGGAIVALCALGARLSAHAAVRDDAVLAVKDDA